MTNPRASADNVRPAASGTFDADLAFLARWSGPLGLFARIMFAYIFLADGAGQISSYADVAGYMAANGVDPRLLPLVMLTEIGGGLLVLFGFKTRWAALALCGFCLLTALFFHMAADQTIELQKNIAMAGGFLTLAIYGPGEWSLDAWIKRRAQAFSSAV